LCDEALSIVRECCGNVVECIHRPLRIDRTHQRRWGCCKNLGYGDHIIEISEKVLDDAVPEDAAMSVVIHEILHACEGGTYHRGKWQEYANKVNRKYPKYQISVSDGAEKFGINRDTISKHKIMCPSCGLTWYYMRETKYVKYAGAYKCAKCNTPLKKIY